MMTKNKAKVTKANSIRSKTRPASKRKATKSKRTYDNVTRESASLGNRSAIIESLVSMLVERKGADVSIAELAIRSKISERTIFRFFKDKAALMQATSEYVAGYLNESNSLLAKLRLEDFTKHSFKAFELNPNLTMAYLFSTFGQRARPIFRKKLNKVLIERIVSERKLKRSPAIDARLALVVSLVNARIWYEMKADFGYSGEVSGDVAAWAIRTLLDGLSKN